jgi:LuxR family maltose regulon positive regulatory protein
MVCPDPVEPLPGSSARGLALAEPLTHSESRVLRYLPTHLTASQIAGELYVSVSTVKTHMSHLYAKLGSHRRTEAVDRARALGLLAASSHPAEGYAVRQHEAAARRWPATAVVST